MNWTIFFIRAYNIAALSHSFFTTVWGTLDGREEEEEEEEGWPTWGRIKSRGLRVRCYGSTLWEIPTSKKKIYMKYIYKNPQSRATHSTPQKEEKKNLIKFF